MQPEPLGQGLLFLCKPKGQCFPSEHRAGWGEASVLPSQGPCSPPLTSHPPAPEHPHILVVKCLRATEVRFQHLISASLGRPPFPPQGQPFGDVGGILLKEYDLLRAY